MWELIVINNASTDNTSQIVDEYKKKKEVNVKIKLLDEPLPGLMNARRKGIENSAYDLLIFCDDDNHLERDYLKQAFRIMREKPEVAIAGGWCKPKLPFYPGKWIEPNYAALAIEASPKPRGYVDWVFGAGMVVRKNIFLELHNRDIKMVLLGRKGSKQTSGDDAELCYLVRFIGHKIYYCPELILNHNVASNRLTRWSFIKANYRNVFMIVYFFLLDKLISNPDIHLQTLYLSFVKQRIKNVFYYLPRAVIERNNFFSFMMFYQNVQLVFWSLIRKQTFENTYSTIKNNLYKWS